MTVTDFPDIPDPGGGPEPNQRSDDHRKALFTAELLQTLIRSRRCYLDDFLDGDGPYWISVGLFINDEKGEQSSLDHILEFADDSMETSLYLLRQMIARRIVQEYKSDDGQTAYRLLPEFGITFGRYLQQQFAEVQQACTRVG